MRHGRKGAARAFSILTWTPAERGCYAHDVAGFFDLLGVRIPLIQAPMAGVSNPALAAAVSGAGGLGSIAVGAADRAETASG